MSEAATAIRRPPAAQAAPQESAAQHRVAELKVSGHLMTLDTGLFCVFQAPGSPAANERSGLPGVRISLPPGPAGRPDAVSISTFRDDGWMNGSDTAALIRVAEGPAQVLVTVYQAPAAPPDTAPRLQVMRLGAEPGMETQGAAGAGQAPSAGVTPEDAATVVARTARRRRRGQDRRLGRRPRQPPVDRGIQPDPARGHQGRRHRVSGRIGTGLAVAVDRGRQVLRQSRHGAAPARTQDPPEGQRGEDA